jgi:deoxyribodipyrimidine photo-lyase
VSKERSFRVSLFLFRRDFRLEDNTGLIFALQSSTIVIPAFIFTPEQIDHNPYRSDHCLQFMLESLDDLATQLKKKGAQLRYFQGDPKAIVKRCIQEVKIDALIVNRDYTPYSRARDADLESVCKKHGVAFVSFDDALLHPPEETVKKDGKPYTIFTPYFKNASQYAVAKPTANRSTNYYQKAISFALKKAPVQTNVSTSLKGGRSEALKILKRLGTFKKYNDARNFPAQNGSTHLSPYLKFNVCSVREVYEAICDALGRSHELVRALYWRDFFTAIAWFFPHVFKGAFQPKYNKLKWSYNKVVFRKWCEGKTGFPIVDAGMREMNQTGFMHNRVRMIAASFLVKDLHIDWRWGEKYFAQMLVDYDPAVNNGNWQWAASTGCDAQPYFRIFNPWNQQEKFDPDCAYIHRWIPELGHLSPKEIHRWHDPKIQTKCTDYPPPIVAHDKEAKRALAYYKVVSH